MGSNGTDKSDSVLLGEVHGAVKQIQTQNTELFKQLKDTRENGTVVCTQNKEQIGEHKKRIDSIDGKMTKAYLVAALIVGGIVGINRIVGLFIK